MEQLLDTCIEGRTSAASEPAQERTEGARGYAGDCVAWVAEDETQLTESRIERIGTR